MTLECMDSIKNVIKTFALIYVVFYQLTLSLVWLRLWQSKIDEFTQINDSIYRCWELDWNLLTWFFAKACGELECVMMKMPSV